jgi:hypothetical protein
LLPLLLLCLQTASGHECGRLKWLLLLWLPGLLRLAHDGHAGGVRYHRHGRRNRGRWHLLLLLPPLLVLLSLLLPLLLLLLLR